MNSARILNFGPPRLWLVPKAERIEPMTQKPYGGYTDPDAQKAWLVAQLMLGTAEKLEHPEQSPLAVNPIAHKQVEAQMREIVRRHWGIVAATRPDNQVDLRDRLFESCKRCAGNSGDAELATDRAIEGFAVYAPQNYVRRVRKLRDLVAALVLAHRSNKGGRGNRAKPGATTTEVQEQICAALGWPATGGAIRQARRRKRKLVTP